MEWILLAVLVLWIATMFAWPSWYRAYTRQKRAADSRYTPPHVMGIFDELYHPDAHAAAQYQEAQAIVPAPAPLPGDRDLYRGRITIRLGRKG
jgi:hypothetical protein